MTEYHDFFRDQYDIKKESPLYWWQSSCDLRPSAGILWIAREGKISKDTLKPLGIEEERYTLGTWQTYEMLAGLSLELLFKSLCVVKGQSFLEDHKLVKLAEIAKVDIKNGKKQYWHFLQSLCIWKKNIQYQNMKGISYYGKI